jgi:tetratricopeptide (TPR) repeat protein
MWNRWRCLACLVVMVFGCSWLTLGAQNDAQNDQSAPPRSDTTSTKREAQAPRQSEPDLSPPRSEAAADPNDSSSRQTKVDLSPPPGEPGLDLKEKSGSDVQEMKPWDPHKADHNVNVGDQYYRKKNYAAAISRYREALYWKNDDAIASFRLAHTLEEVGQYAEARKYYQLYLKILPQGEYAAESQKAIERLKGKPDDPKKAAAAGMPSL